MTAGGALQVAGAGAALAVGGALAITSGTLTASAGGSVTAAALTLGGATLADDTTARMTIGTASAQAGTITVGTDGTLSGSGAVIGAIADIGTIAATAGRLALLGDVGGTGVVTIGTGAMLYINGVLGAAVRFAGTDATLSLVQGSPAGTVAGFAAGDSLDLLGVAATAGQWQATSGGGVLRLSGPGGAQATIDLIGSFAGQAFAISPDAAGGSDVALVPAGGALAANQAQISVACFRAGTQIATPAGARAVESLRPGDRVLVTREARSWRVVRWVGRTVVEPCRHADPDRVWPVRVRANAFAPGLPRRDVFLSPDHSVLVGDAEGAALVPIGLLANGASIATEMTDGPVTYIHVELDAHAVLLAEGLPAETYLDTGNRDSLEALAPPAAMPPPSERCAPLLLGGERLAGAHARLLDRARRGFAGLTDDPAPRFEFGGAALPAERLDPAIWRVGLPAAGGLIRLASRSIAPPLLDPAASDHRRLGIALAGLAIDGQDIALDGPELRAGFHPSEQDADTAWRWTDGDALLRIPPGRAGRSLTLRTHPWARYWDTPAAACGAAYLPG